MFGCANQAGEDNRNVARMAALLAGELGGVAFAAALLGVAGLVIASYLATARASGDFGLTSEVVLLLTFGLGATAMLGLELEAAGAAVVTAWAGAPTRFDTARGRVARTSLHTAHRTRAKNR